MRRRHGFTLIELLVVIAIIAILVALLLPAVQQVREAARKSQCQDHLHNIAIAIHDYEISYKLVPPGNIGQIVRDQRQPNWLTLLLPFVEQKPAYDAFDIEGGNLSGQGTPPIGAVNVTIMGQLRVEMYDCPSSPMPGFEAINGGAGSVQLVNYVGNSGSRFSGTNLTSDPPPAIDNQYGIGTYNGILVPANSRGITVGMQNITDGTSNVIVAGEQSNYVGGTNDRRSCGHVNGSWSSGPTSPQFNDLWRQSITTYLYPINEKNPNLAGMQAPYNQNNPYTSAHPGGAQFALMDGVVKFISENIDNGTMIRLCDRADGQPIGSF
ncbi:MAG: DUF1559 domain-containing protein [Planctomycetaceae bacterium]